MLQNKSKNIATAVLMLFVTQAMQSCSEQGDSIDKELSKAAVNLNKKLPTMLGEEARMDSVSAIKGRLFQYHVTVLNDSGKFVNEKFTKEFRFDLVEQVKTNPDFKPFRKNDVTMVYLYKNESGRLIFEIRITPKDYK